MEQAADVHLLKQGCDAAAGRDPGDDPDGAGGGGGADKRDISPTLITQRVRTAGHAGFAMNDESGVFDDSVS
ncbi:MAG: hypothetical protein U0165_12080 [Polyangiaceae bacterium]